MTQLEMMTSAVDEGRLMDVMFDFRKSVFLKLVWDALWAALVSMS